MATCIARPLSSVCPRGPLARRLACYQRRRPERTPLYKIVGEFLESWLQWRLLQERRIPAQVEKELRQYLECGILLGVCASEV